MLKGRLNQMMLRFWFIFVWLLLVLLNFNSKSVYPLSLRAFSYWFLDKIKTSSLEKFLDKRSLITIGIWLIICDGWFEDLLIYNSKSFGFLYSLYVPSFKLNVKCKRSTIIRSMAKANIFKHFNNIFAHSIYFLTIYISQYEQSVIPI